MITPTPNERTKALALAGRFSAPGCEETGADLIADAMAEARATLVMAFLELIDQHIQRAEDATAQDAAHLTGLAAALLLRRLRQEAAALLPAGARGAKPGRRRS